MLAATFASATVPVVDITGFLSGNVSHDRLLAAQWDDAMSAAGVAIVTGHSVPVRATDEMYEAAHEFFGYALEEKMASCLHKGYGYGGYVPVGVEAVARSTEAGAGAPADVAENLVFSFAGDRTRESVVPPRPPTLQPAVQEYWSHMLGLLRVLMALSAVALELPPAHFDADFAQPKCNLRLAHYPAVPAEAEPGALRYGAHTDYTGFTILRADPLHAGLQAQLVDGSWVDVPPHPTGFVVNAGDLIQVWTNDRWRSPPHRVVKPPVGTPVTRRLSLVFFTGPADETQVDALPSCVGPDRPRRYPTVSAREHLMNKLRRSNTKEGKEEL